MDRMLVISGSPHIHAPFSARGAMWRVIFALLPALGCALYYFGIGAAIVSVTAMVGCVAVEYLIARFMMGRKSATFSVSALLTGLLLALNLPSNIPVWIVLIGCVVAIGIGKMAFGGLGCNIFNPALVGRVFLLLSFPQQMTSWPLPEVNRMAYLDASTGATVLSELKTGVISPSGVDLVDEAIGLTGGSMGEVGALALIIGVLYLMVSRVITWHIPVAVVGAVALMTVVAGGNVGVELMGGGLLLGAFFMATDYVTSPMTPRGMLVYGAMIGVITMVIRHYGAYPEGVSFAILVMNGVTPLLNKWFRPRRFGERRVAHVR